MPEYKWNDPQWAQTFTAKSKAQRTRAEQAEQRAAAKSAATVRDARRALGYTQGQAWTVLGDADMDLPAYLAAEAQNDATLLRKVRALPVHRAPLGGAGRVARATA